MRVIFASLLTVSLLYSQTEIKELEKEIKKLEKLKEEIHTKLERNREVLAKIEQEKKSLEELRKRVEKEIKEIEKKRYKKLAKDFENMDPEYAGEKLSKFDDPKIAAYILFNMNSRKAGEALNYTDAKMVNKISKILTQLKNEK